MKSSVAVSATTKDSVGCCGEMGENWPGRKGWKALKGRWNWSLNLKDAWQLVHQAEKRKGVLTTGRCAKARIHIPLGKRMNILFLGQGQRVRGPRCMLKDFGFTRGKAVIRPACENGTCLPCAISMRIIAGRLGRHCWEWPMWGKEGRNRKPWALLVFRHFISIGSHSYSQRQEGNIIPIL